MLTVYAVNSSIGTYLYPYTIAIIFIGKDPDRVTPINRKWQDYVYIQCEYKSTKQKIKHLLREENKVKENKIS